ncbi:MAG TPA: cytochrome P450 [Gemmatimonadaceae bacterium]|nr:cytochrome P450 [Gemmatimonadaceae bacterium]
MPLLASPPRPRRCYPGHYLVTLARNPLALLRSMASCGDVSEIAIGPQRLVLASHPDDIQRILVSEQRSFRKGRALERSKLMLGEGLLTSDGAYHLRQRRLVQPAFHREQVARYAAVMADFAARADAEWRDGDVRDVHDAMMRLTLAIVCKTLFATELDAETVTEIGEAVSLSLQMFQYTVLPFGAILEQLPLPFVRRLRRARERLDKIVYDMVAELRRGEGGDRRDLPSMLLAARDADGSALTDEQIRDEIITLIAAGHETTAVALSWTWYLLSQHPVVAGRLHHELDAVLGGRTPTVADVELLVYTRAVLAESMRLYPPAWILERRAIEDVEIGGYTVRAGTLVLVSQYLAHRDPRWWSDPERFDPSRWLTSAIRPKFAYFPFGAGTRACVGESFAWMEGILILATLAQRWQMSHDPTHEVVPEPMITLRPRYGMRMRLESITRSYPAART